MHGTTVKKKDTLYSKWTEYTRLQNCVRKNEICRGSSIIFGTHILSFLVSRMLDHTARGQANVNYSLPRVPNLFIVLHK